MLSNLLSLSSIQVLNYILPLITLPYLVRVLGPRGYGLTAFAQAIAQYFVLFTSYGFNLTATQHITINKGNSQVLSRLVSAVLGSKVILMVCSAIIYFGIIVAVPSLNVNMLLFSLSFGYVLADFSFPLWLFQGLEDMKFITLGNVVSKIVSTLCIFIFIRNSSNIWLVPLIMSSGSVLGGTLSSTIVFRKYGLRLVRVTCSNIWVQLRDGWLVFFSQVMISLYTTSNPVILGIFAGPVMVGYYSAAAKIITAAQGVLSVISQTIFPHTIQLFQHSAPSGLLFVHKVMKIITPLTVFIGVCLCFCAIPIVSTLLGSKYGPSVLLLRVLSPLPCIIFLSNMLGIQIMLNLNLKKAFSNTVLIGAGTNLVLSFILVPIFQQLGTAISVVVSEIVITVTMYIFLKQRGIDTLRGRMV